MRTKTETRRTGLALSLLLALAALAPAAAAAQVFTPTFMGPRSGGDLGVYLSDRNDDLTIEGILRGGFGGYDLGVRGGLVDTDGEALVTLGGELRNPLLLGAAPLDLAFTAGVQAILGDADALGFQGGLSIGHTFVPGGFTLTPYLHPRAALINGFGPNDELDLDLLADFGLDFDFGSRLALRFGFSIEDRGAEWGVGLAWR